MIGTGLKKLATEHGMAVSSGVAYGNYEGFAASMFDGPNIKCVAFHTRFPEQAAVDWLQRELSAMDLLKTYRIRDLSFGADGLVVVFKDTIGTMKRVRAFLDVLIPRLRGAGATGVGVCASCGQPLDPAAGWQLVNGGMAYHLHDTCAQRVQQQADRALQEELESDTGSYGRGFIGALIGAILGAIVWALVLYFGYLAAIVGFLIGVLAELGYRKLGGKKGKGKVPILIIAALIGIVLGTFGADVIDLSVAISKGEIDWLSYGDIPRLLLTLLREDSEYAGSVLKNLGLGVVFAALGMFGILRAAGNETKSMKMTQLK